MAVKHAAQSSTMPQTTSSAETKVDQRPVFFFDIDDCLYPRSLGVAKMMYERLEKFTMDNLSLSKEEAYELNKKYFEEYTLSVIGLHRYHNIDPMEFNEANDNSLPLDSILSYDEELRAILMKFDPAKVKLWLFTNAYITHGQRVVKLLGVDDLFEGITYCDYTNGVWPLKPNREMFAKAEQDAGVTDPEQCFFVDDNPRNCHAALGRGWQVVRIRHEDENILQMPEEKSACRAIDSLNELHDLFPQFAR